MSKPRQGRCPECGEVVMVEIIKGKPGRVLLHGCQSRACEYPGCRLKGLIDEMVQAGSVGEWYCPAHGLLAAARELVSLYRVEARAILPPDQAIRPLSYYAYPVR